MDNTMREKLVDVALGQDSSMGHLAIDVLEEIERLEKDLAVARRDAFDEVLLMIENNPDVVMGIVDYVWLQDELLKRLRPGAEDET